VEDSYCHAAFGFIRLGLKHLYDDNRHTWLIFKAFERLSYMPEQEVPRAFHVVCVKMQALFDTRVAPQELLVQYRRRWLLSPASELYRLWRLLEDLRLRDLPPPQLHGIL
jgi:hypothetical protein